MYAAILSVQAYITNPGSIGELKNLQTYFSQISTITLKSLTAVLEYLIVVIECLTILSDI